MEVNTERVIIVGGGCSGLALAQGLKKAGIPVTVLEKTSQESMLTGRDWNMATHWGLPDLAELIPLQMYTRLPSATVDPHTPIRERDELRFLQGNSGELLLAVPVQNLHRLRRSKLRELLAEGHDVRYGCSLSRVDFSDDGQHVTVFDNAQGMALECRMLVGADGASSFVRNQLLPHEATLQERIPYRSTFLQANYTAEQARFLRSFHSLNIGAVHPIGRFDFCGMQNVPDPDRPETWTFFFNITWPLSLETQEGMDASPEASLLIVKDLAKDFYEPWRSGIGWVNPDAADTWNVWAFTMGIWDPRTPGHQWDNKDGRITLVGDAAHTMTVQRAQGLNHALRSARELRDAIKQSGDGEVSRKEAIDVHESSMQARAGAEVELSKANTEMLHDWEKFKESPLYRHNMRRAN